MKEILTEIYSCLLGQAVIKIMPAPFLFPSVQVVEQFAVGFVFLPPGLLCAQYSYLPSLYHYQSSLSLPVIVPMYSPYSYIDIPAFSSLSLPPKTPSPFPLLSFSVSSIFPMILLVNMVQFGNLILNYPHVWFGKDLVNVSYQVWWWYYHALWLSCWYDTERLWIEYNEERNGQFHFKSTAK